MKFLAFTDMHYSDIPQAGERNRPESLNKVKRIISEHASDCDFIINFGDTADEVQGGTPQDELWQQAADVLRASSKPFYALIGNHDTSTDKRILADIMGMPARYYSFMCGGYKIICLDANNNDEKTVFPEKEILWSETFVDDEQFEWLKKELEEAECDVLIFSHELLILKTLDNDDDHVMRNRHKIIDLIESSKKVRAFFAGHYHWGDYVKHGDVNYITFRSICLENDAAHAVVTVDENSITVEGYEGQISLTV